MSYKQEKALYTISTVIVVFCILYGSWLISVEIVLGNVDLELDNLGLVLIIYEFLKTMMNIIFWAVLYGLAAVGIHEFGHVVFGLFSGFQPNFIELFGFRLAKYQDGLHLSKENKFSVGMVSLTLPSDEKDPQEKKALKKLNLRFRMLLAGGVLFSALTVTAIFFSFGVNAHTYVFGLFSLAINLYGITPNENHFMIPDGTGLLYLTKKETKYPATLFFHLGYKYSLKARELPQSLTKAEKEEKEKNIYKQIDSDLLTEIVETEEPYLLYRCLRYAIKAHLLRDEKAEALALADKFFELNKGEIRKNPRILARDKEYVSKLLDKAIQHIGKCQSHSLPPEI